MFSSGPELGLAGMQRIIRKSGAERVSDDAANELRIVLEQLAEKIAKSAVELSLHAGRKTIKPEDIRLAAKTYLECETDRRRSCPVFYKRYLRVYVRLSASTERVFGHVPYLYSKFHYADPHRAFRFR